MVSVTEIRCQQGCNKLGKNHLPYGWDMNIYRGCQHGCVYCYALYSHDYISKKNYYEDLYVKVNIPEQLERQLSSPSWKREEIGIGGVTDSYQPIEAKYKLMPEILKVLIKYKTPCSISTKSDLILRDYDLIDELSRVAYVSVSASVNTMDEEVRKKIEPGAKSAIKRFNMLKEFSKTNAFTGVLQMPVIPYISDSRENVEELYASAADSNVDYLVRGVMYLRGKTRGVFFDFIRREYPELLEKLTTLYGNNSLRSNYKSSLYLMMNELKSKYRLSGNYLNPVKKGGKKEWNKDSEYTQLSLFESEESIARPNEDYERKSSIIIPVRGSHSTGVKDTTANRELKVNDWNLEPFVEVEIGQGESSQTKINQIEKNQDKAGQSVNSHSDAGRNESNQSEPINHRQKREDRNDIKESSSRKNKTEQVEDERNDFEVTRSVEIKVGMDQEVEENPFISSGELIEPVIDEKRALYYSMRQIARENMSFYTDQAKIFYEQGQFMKDATDDYGEVAPFSVHYPYYQRMGMEQLRTYFTWRTKIRGGQVEAVPTSYAFLYIYELLNRIGVNNPLDGLDKLLEFWTKFRKVDSVIDKYVYQWLKDYHVYYPLERTFSQFATDHSLVLEYPTVFGYGSNEEISFELFARISKYKIKESIFYTEENQEIIAKCFYFVLEAFRSKFREKDKCFEDLIFHSQRSRLSWEPFRRALFYPALEHSHRQVVISEREVYTCTEEGWQYTGVMLSEQGRRLMGYIMREMECSLRKILKFKHKLTANSQVCSERSLSMLLELGIVFPQSIQEWVREFYSLYTRKEVKVDIVNLQEIRNKALETQEKLIVPEEDRQLEQATTSHPGEQLTESCKVSEDVEVTEPWARLKGSFTEIEEEAIKLILKEQPINSFALEKGIMLEVLIDDINQKAMDCIGDTLLEIDDTVSIHGEYKDNL